MLLEEFDPETKAVINPEQSVQKIEGFPAVTISCFSHTLFHEMLSLFEAEEIAGIHGANGVIPVYQVIYQGEPFAFYQSRVGEPACVGDYEEVVTMGSQCMILFGNCGVLDRNIEDCGIIIPRHAIRDEGTSYHYAPASDFIDVNDAYAGLFKDVCSEHGYHYVEGTTWTTDSFYRETPEKMKRRKAQGALCVEMECAGMQAMCSFRHTDFFTYYYAGDNLDHTSWDPRSLSNHARLDDKAKIALLAFELGLKINAQKRKQNVSET